MTATRCHDDLPSEMQDLSFFSDLSAFTMQQRRQLATITKPLINNHIPYRWLYPAKLLVTKDGVSSVIMTMKEGLKLWRMIGKDWQILEPQNMVEYRQNSPPSARVHSDAETWILEHLEASYNSSDGPRECHTVLVYSFSSPQVTAVVFLHRFQRNCLFLYLRLSLRLVFP